MSMTNLCASCDSYYIHQKRGRIGGVDGGIPTESIHVSKVVIRVEDYIEVRRQSLAANELPRVFDETLRWAGIHSNDVRSGRLEVLDAGHELTDLCGAVWTLISRKTAQHQKNNRTFSLHYGEFNLFAGRSPQFEVRGLSAYSRAGHWLSLARFGVRV